MSVILCVSLVALGVATANAQLLAAALFLAPVVAWKVGRSMGPPRHRQGIAAAVRQPQNQREGIVIADLVYYVLLALGLAGAFGAGWIARGAR